MIRIYSYLVDILKPNIFGWYSQNQNTVRSPLVWSPSPRKVSDTKLVVRVPQSFKLFVTELTSLAPYIVAIEVENVSALPNTWKSGLKIYLLLKVLIQRWTICNIAHLYTFVLWQMSKASFSSWWPADQVAFWTKIFWADFLEIFLGPCAIVVKCTKYTYFIFLLSKTYHRPYIARGAGFSDVNFNDFYANDAGI